MLAQQKHDHEQSLVATLHTSQDLLFTWLTIQLFHMQVQPNAECSSACKIQKAAPAVTHMCTDYLTDMFAAVTGTGGSMPRNDMAHLKLINPQVGPITWTMTLPPVEVREWLS